MMHKMWIIKLKNGNGTIEYDTRGVMYVNGVRVEITKKLRTFLSALLHAQGQIVSRQEISVELWGSPHHGLPGPGTGRLDKTVDRLRDCFTQGTAELIRTVKGGGFYFDCERASVRCTAVGALPDGACQLRPGLLLPGQNGDLKLLRKLGQSTPGLQSWLAQNCRGSSLLRVLRIATDDVRRVDLEQERACNLQLVQEGAGAHVPRIHNACLQKGPPYWLEIQHFGQSLTDWAAEQNHLAGMGAAVVVDTWLTIAEALLAGHNIGLPHGNLKPSNILMLSSGRQTLVRLADWSSARSFDGAYLKSWESDPSGGGPPVPAPSSLPYLSPELFCDCEQPGSAKSDVYAMAVLFYQLLIRDFKRSVSHGFEAHVPAPLRGPLKRAVCGAPDARPTLDEFVKDVQSVDGYLEAAQERQWQRS
jgi:DNA-binding winged helix-turn-helix (wHTH) protein